jgi:mono/diheme cytochrome c family protein
MFARSRSPGFRTLRERQPFIRRSPHALRFRLRVTPLVANVCLVSVLGPLLPALHGQDAATFFRSNCYTCHTIGGGRLTGPDLKEVTSRRDRSWLLTFLLNPKDVIDSGDEYARQLLQEARGVIMPRVPGMDRARAESLLDLIESESRLEESHFRGLEVSDRPLRPADIQAGSDLFHGRRSLDGGGPPCLTCHAVTGTAVFGGGIGPDLTKAFERLGGRRALSAWLLAPQSRTMAVVWAGQPLTPEEISQLAAFLEERAKNAPQQDAGSRQTGLLLAGTLGAVLMSWAVSRLVGRPIPSPSPPEDERIRPAGHTPSDGEGPSPEV